MRMSQRGTSINIVFKWSNLMLKIFVGLFACFDISNPLQTNFSKSERPNQNPKKTQKKKKEEEIKAYKMNLISSYLI